MLFITEGPPSSGKTTLLRKLRAELAKHHARDGIHTMYGHDIRHVTPQGTKRSPTIDDYLAMYVDRLDEYVPDGKTQLLLDEWHWTHPVYEKVFTTQNVYTPGTTHYVDLVLYRLGALVLHCNPDVEALTDRIMRRNPNLDPNPRIVPALADIRAAYVARSHESAATVAPPLASLTGLLTLAEHERRRAFNRREWPLYLGPERPKLLFVEYDPTTYASFNPGSRTGAAFLHQALSYDQEFRAKVGYVNRGAMSTESFASLLKFLNHPKIVCTSLDPKIPALDMAHVKIRNPFEVYRAYPGTQEKYGTFLRSLLDVKPASAGEMWRFHPDPDEDEPTTTVEEPAKTAPKKAPAKKAPTAKAEKTSEKTSEPAPTSEPA